MTTSKTQLHTDMNPGTCNLLSPEMQLSKKLLVIHFRRGGNEGHVLLDGGEAQIGIPCVLKGSSEPEWISNPRPDTFHLLLHSGKQELGKNYQADSDLTDRGLRSNAAVPHITGLLSAVSVEQMFDAQSKTSRSGRDLMQTCKRTAPPELRQNVLTTHLLTLAQMHSNYFPSA